jgi:hypothetical protein
MERASEAVPYIDEDDEMESSLFWSMKDYPDLKHPTASLI